MSNRLYSAANFNEAVYRPMKLITKPVVVIAGLLLAALLLAPTFSVSAQSPQERTYRYNENRTDPIASFRADRDVAWNLSGTDADVFSISSSGVLTFKSTPNYEDPKDGEDDADGNGTIDTDEGVGNNVYLVNIRANGTVLVAATVKVINVDDLGKVALSHLQPAEGVEYEADATDEDDGYRDDNDKLFEDFSANNTPDNSAHDDGAANTNDAELARWKWEKSQSGTSGWATIADAVSHTYTPESADVGYYLRVTATYSNRDLYDDDTTAPADTDPVANAPIRTARAVSDYPVKAEDNTNQAPVFADDDDDVDGNQQEREVNENDKNALVGAPVRARDSDVLHYSLSNVQAFLDRNDDGTLPTALETSPGKFKIDKATGQISVNGSLSHEAAAVYTVVVTARDPFKADDTVTVTIDVNDVNDAPEFSDAGATTLWVTENTGANADPAPAEGASLTGDDPSTDETETADNFTYTATDEDSYDADNSGAIDADEVESVSYFLAGPDKSAFTLAPTTVNTNADSVILRFKDTTKVNFEKQDAYNVTIVASDQRKLTKTRDVTVRVIDAEDTGTIKFSTRQPQVGQPIAAEVVDEDGVKGSITWTWTKADLTPNADNEVVACTDTSLTYGAIPDDAAETRDNKATFTPLAADVNTGNAGEFVAYCLQVSASYNDGFDREDVANDPPEDSAIEEAASPVLPLRRSNSRPVFKEDGKVITSTTREVVEDGDQPRTVSQMNVGNAVAAEDPDDDRTDGPDGTAIKLNDNLTYSLRGEDAASFTVREDSGQIMVKAKLDYETKNTYRVTVRATDGSRAYRDLPVTINITNVNERPVVSGSAAVTVEENDTAAVGTYAAVDPEGDAFIWSLKPGNDDDAGKFRIDANSGVLSFKSPPNYEGMGDRDKNNIYEVTVRATDTVDNRGEKNVEVTVTDVDDLGRIRLSMEQPGEDVLLMATLHDDDELTDKPGAATWQWAIGDSAGGTFEDIENATNADYQPDSDDVAKYLRVTASYGSASNPKTVSKVSAHPVKARDLANPLPVFPDQEPASTETRETDQDRDVPENSSSGTLVGDPVTASDDDILTYSIFDGHDDDKETEPSKLFTIDQATGQIKVGSAELDYETAGEDLYMVTVTATDTSNASEDVKVTIIVTDVDEKPRV